MLTPDEIKIKLQHPTLNLAYISRDAKVDYNLLWRFANNKLQIIPYDLIKTLSDYYNAA